MNHHTTVSLPVASDLSGAPVYSAIKLTPTGIALASPGDLAIGSLITPNLAPQIANQSAVGMMADVFLYSANGIHFAPVGDAAAYAMGDTLQLGGAAAGQVVHNTGGPFAGLVLYGCLAGSLGAIIRIIAAVGVQALPLILFLLLLAGFMTPEAHAGSGQPLIALTGTNAPPNLPVADAGRLFDSLSLTGTSQLYFKIYPTVLNVSATNGGTIYSPTNALDIYLSGTNYPLGSGTTSFIDLSSTATIFTSASPTFPSTLQLAGTSFQIFGSDGATVTGSCSLTGTGWASVSGTNNTGTIVQ